MSQSKSRLLAIGIAATMAMPVLLANPGPAQADVRIRVGGKVRVRAGARVRVRDHRRGSAPVVVTHRPRHRLHVHGTVVLGGGIYFGPTFAEPPPPYVPCTCCDCDPGVPAYYTPPPPPQPVAVPPAEVPVIIAAPRPPMARFGLGLFAGNVELEDGASGGDYGVMVRYRLTRRLAVEAEIGKASMEGGDEERRVGAGLQFDFSGRARLSPYLVGAAGAWDGERYGELGAGLTYRLSRNLHLSADLRRGIHCESCSEEPVPADYGAPPPSDDVNGAYYTRGRLAAILHF